MTGFASTFALVFVSELGDKSMLLALTLAGRYRWWVVLLAITIAAAALMAIAVIAGGAIDAVLPRRWIAVTAAVLFVGFGVWTWMQAERAIPEEELSTGRQAAWLTVLALAGAFALAEFGDKTQLVVLSLSGLNPSSRFAVWFGGTLGFVVVDGIAVLLGDRLKRLVSPMVIARASAVVFVVFGVLTLALAADA